MTTADAFKRFRQNFNLSQQKIADFLGVNQSAIAQYERNTNLPNVVSLIKIAENFNVSIDYLLGLSDNPTPNNSPVINQVDAASVEKDKSKINQLENDIAELKSKMKRLEEFIKF